MSVAATGNDIKSHAERLACSRQSAHIGNRLTCTMFCFAHTKASVILERYGQHAVIGLLQRVRHRRRPVKNSACIVRVRACAQGNSILCRCYRAEANPDHQAVNRYTTHKFILGRGLNTSFDSSTELNKSHG